MQFSRCFIALLFICCCLTVSADAKTGYVVDQIVISLRSEKSRDADVVKNLRTGTPLEILAEEGNYLKVRTEDGTEGYVIKQFIVRSTPKPIIITGLKKERDQLKEKLAALEGDKTGFVNKLEESLAQSRVIIKQHEADKARLTESISVLENDQNALTGKHNALLEQSGRVIDTATERDQLKEENSRLTGEMKTLSDENRSLMRTGMIKWFLAGGGVFLTGWIAGRISRKKRNRL